MGRINVFADESGNFDFSRTEGASRYFILTTISCVRYDVGDALLALRRDLAWAGLGLASEFHATTDSQAIRDRVFDTIRCHTFRIDATVLEKAKAAPGERSTDEAFYGTAWRQHMAVVARETAAGDQMLVVSAALGTRRKRSTMHAAVQDAVRDASPATEVRVASWDAQSDPCLQVADYCCWAIRRKWEMGDVRSYALISEKIGIEREAWAERTVLHY